jgi:hypothetical protein
LLPITIAFSFLNIVSVLGVSIATCLLNQAEQFYLAYGCHYRQIGRRRKKEMAMSGEKALFMADQEKANRQ